jgi:hypothetical protein
MESWVWQFFSFWHFLIIAILRKLRGGFTWLFWWRWWLFGL